jgi:peptidoglycan hydrolase CwlO-like protein
MRKMKRPKKPPTRQQLQAKIEELKPKIHMADWDVAEAQEELNQAEEKLEELEGQMTDLKVKLKPLLRPWERQRHQTEQKITVYMEVMA